MRFFLALALWCTLVMQSLAEPVEIEVLVYEEHFSPVEDLLQAYPKCYQAPLFEQPNIHLMELVLLCKALFLGGLDYAPYTCAYAHAVACRALFATRRLRHFWQQYLAVSGR